MQCKGQYLSADAGSVSEGSFSAFFSFSSWKQTGITLRTAACHISIFSLYHRIPSDVLKLDFLALHGDKMFVLCVSLPFIQLWHQLLLLDCLKPEIHRITDVIWWRIGTDDCFPLQHDFQLQESTIPQLSRAGSLLAFFGTTKFHYRDSSTLWSLTLYALLFVDTTLALKKSGWSSGWCVV